MAVQLGELVEHLDNLLQVQAFADYCPNGLQVEGRPVVSKLVAGVTASQALVDAAVERGADAIFVHHGYFWKGEDARITGIKRKRLATLLANDISLLAYHLPLDEHPELGNNAQLAIELGLQLDGRLDATWPGAVGLVGHLAQAQSGEVFARSISDRLGREVLHVPAQRDIKRVAWCTGGGQGYIEAAVAAGVDAYISGEVSEQTVHVARECGLHFYAAGHHATERYGARAVADYLARQFGLDSEFIDIPNPA